MEELNIVYFTITKKEQPAKTITKCFYKSDQKVHDIVVKTTKSILAGRDISLWRVSLPSCASIYLDHKGRQRSKTEWTKESFQDYFKWILLEKAARDFPMEGMVTIYAMSKQVQEWSGFEAEQMSYPWTRCLLDYYMAASSPSPSEAIEMLLILDDNAMECERLIETYLHKVKQVAVVTDRVEEYDELCDYYEQEYGLQIQVEENLRDIGIPIKRNILVLGGDKRYDLIPSMLTQYYHVLTTCIPGSSQEKEWRSLVEHSKVHEYLTLPVKLSIIRTL